MVELGKVWGNRDPSSDVYVAMKACDEICDAAVTRWGNGEPPLARLGFVTFVSLVFLRQPAWKCASLNWRRHMR